MVKVALEVLEFDALHNCVTCSKCKGEGEKLDKRTGKWSVCEKCQGAGAILKEK